MDDRLDKYTKIKKRLREAIELNESLSRGFQRAQKKIKLLYFERNLLLDRLAQNHHEKKENNHAIIINKDESSEETSDEEPAGVTSKLTTVASAPPKRTKMNKMNIKTRRVQPIERDNQGHPKLPQQIGVLTVLSLGKINPHQDAFHNERYIFPVGYTVRRTYPSMIDPHNNTVITSTIIDGGDGPRFHVLASDQPMDPIIANSATGAWTVVVRKSNEIRHREHSNSASGPDYYGFKHPTIAKMIQDLPGANQLKNYVWQNFQEMEPRAAKGVMAAAEKKRETLDLMGGNSITYKKSSLQYKKQQDEQMCEKVQ